MENNKVLWLVLEDYIVKSPKDFAYIIFLDILRVSADDVRHREEELGPGHGQGQGRPRDAHKLGFKLVVMSQSWSTYSIVMGHNNFNH